MGKGLPGPYIVGAGGGTYFAILPPEEHLLRGYKYLLDARQIMLRSIPGAEGRARALAIDVVLKEVQTRVKVAAAQTAAEADKQIVTLIKSSQVRPDPKHSRSGLRLQDGIQSRPLVTALAGGGVGIADIDVLDKVADANGTPYWRAQEFGSTHNVGRVIHGYFQPGRVRATGASYRFHPTFKVEQGGAEMVISRPIPERAFLREGALAAEVFRQKALGNAVSPAFAELKLIQSGNHPRIKQARSYLRGRKP